MATVIETELRTTGGDEANKEVQKQIGAFKELKKSYKDAIDQLAALTEGTAEYNEQAARIGQIRDQINALNESIATVSGSPVENLSGSFGLLSQQVGTLDFGGAATSLGAFSNQIRSFSFKDLIAGAKQFGQTLGQLGKALLANPIFLIGGIIIAVGAAVFALKDKIKFLGDAFEAVGNVISDAVQALKDFTDYIGLTSFAIEEKAEKTIAAAKAEQEAVSARYDSEIAIASAAGKKTEELEKKKQIAILQSLKIQLDALETLRSTQGEYTEEQIKQIAEIGKAVMAADTAIKVQNAKAAKEKADEAKKATEDAKKANEARAADNKKLLQQIRDEQIAAIKDEEQREFTKAVEDQKRRDADIAASKASADIKRQALVASQLQLETDLQAINKKYDDKRKADEEKRIEEEKKLKAEALDRENKDLIAGVELRAAQAPKDIEAQIAVLTAKRDVELQNEQLTANEKLLIQQQYESDVKKIKDQAAQEEKERKLKERQDALDIASSVTGSLASLSDTVYQVRSKNLKKGSAEEEAAAKKQFKIQKALALTGAIIDAAKGVLTSLASAPLAIGPVPNPVGIASLAAVVAAGIANIAKISATQYQGSSSSGSGGSSPSVGGGAGGGDISGFAAAGTSASTFRAETIGQAGTQNGNGSNERNGNSDNKVYLVETDVTKIQKKVSTIESQATIG